MALDYPPRLTFSDVDDLAFAAELGRLQGSASNCFVPTEIGPLIELVQISQNGHLPPLEVNPWISLSTYRIFYSALTSNRAEWVSSRGHIGFIRTTWDPLGDDTPWVNFCYQMRRAAVAVGFQKKIAAQLIGAIGELQSNIYEHSEAAQTGVVAFQVRPKFFEFVVSDQGIGVLASLRSCLDYAHLNDHGQALLLTLRKGKSRFGSARGRGYGFRPLFTGFANLNGALRFRSGNHALTIDGRSPTLMTAKVAQKPRIKGFFISISCSL